MQTQSQRTIRFQLTGDKKPKNFQIPINNILYPKRLESGQKVRKKIHYIPGVESIYVEDYKGDQKKEQIWLTDGFLDVHPENASLLKILSMHPWNGIKFEIVDKESKAIKELEEFEKIELALEKVNITLDDEAKATALVIVGEGLVSATNKEIRASLKRMAHKSPQILLDEFNKPGYKAKYSAALAIMRGVVVVNPTATGVTWPDGKLIIPVAVGKNPIDTLGQFLNENTEQSLVTLQTIGNLIKRSYIKNIPVTAEEEIQEVIQDKTVVAKKEVIAESTETETEVEVETELEIARRLYKEQYNRDVPPNMKNKLDWLNAQLKLVE